MERTQRGMFRNNYLAFCFVEKTLVNTLLVCRHRCPRHPRRDVIPEQSIKRIPELSESVYENARQKKVRCLMKLAGI